MRTPHSPPEGTAPARLTPARPPPLPCRAVTDGEDTESKTSLTDVCDVLRSINRVSNFKVLIAGTGLSNAARSALYQMASVGDE